MPMRLVCPRCAAAYEVPPTVLGRPRKVRCARCGTDWVASGERSGEAEPASSEAGGASEAMEPRPPPPSGMAGTRLPALRGSLTALRLGWAASVLALGIGAWGAVAWRGSVMSAWPPSQRFYATLGLAPAHLADRASGRAADSRNPARRPPPARGGGEE